ncbi:MFS transporter [Polynucleobacter sp. MWH-Spelu-300-X4]|uniref:MFS transporter n=1 Tax=Polynucleobacter sp. MWH-Spelu-300-X4 TaxID=2689109 RepID=UPI001BFCE68C|nr:MFS transporter [Polynucleobacter sp. MWH-Spelu-300-X4]QWD80366.1 MFS transporter [Polynucleobacter sp. MWH-Spelu-300-X4]
MKNALSMVPILALAAFCSLTAMRITDPLLPAIAREFSITAGNASHIVSAFAMAYGICQFLFGPLADKFGKLHVITWALFLSILANLGVALSSNLETIIIWRALSGGAAAGIVPLAMAWIGETVEYENRQPVLAKLLFGTLGGTIGGQILGGICADSSDWRWGFYLLASLYLICCVTLWQTARQLKKTHQPKKSDDKKAHQHVLHVLSQKWPRVILLMVGLEGVALYGALAFIPFYLHTKLDISLTLSGSIMATFGLGGLLYASSAKYFINQLGEKGLALFGGLLLGFAFLLLIFTTHWILAVIAVFLIGLGLYMLHNTLQTHATQMAPQSRGTAVSLFACSLFLGQFIGVTSAGYLVDTVGVITLFSIAGIGLPLVGWRFSVAIKNRTH